MRNLDTVAVLDLDTASVVWAATGPWRAQHDAQFLDNGHLLIFDNRGGPSGSRVLEYDPQRLAFPWSYPGVGGRTFYSSERGMNQRPPNGNTLIVDSEGGQIIEVSRDRQVVWSYPVGRFITTTRRWRRLRVSSIIAGCRTPRRFASDGPPTCASPPPRRTCPRTTWR